jgi:type IV secretion system protein VirB6
MMMQQLRALICLFLLVCSAGKANAAATGWWPKSSCTAEFIFLTQIVNDIATLGVWEAVQGDFVMVSSRGCGADDPQCLHPDLTQISDNDKTEARLVYANAADACLAGQAVPGVCSSGGVPNRNTSYAPKKVQSCEVPHYSAGIEEIWFEYAGVAKRLKIGRTIAVGGVAGPGTGAWLRAKDVADKVCIQAWMGFVGWQTLGCKMRAPASNGSGATTKCYVSAACVGGAQSHSKGFFPVTGVIVECVKKTLDNVFTSSCGSMATGSAAGGTYNATTMLANFQIWLRQVIMAALSLYVIFYGIKIALVHEVPKKGELVTFIFKMLFVIYFSIGFPASGGGTVTSAAGDQIANGISGSGGSYQDPATGVVYIHGVTFLKRLLVSAADSFSAMLMQSGSGNGLCLYSESDYTNDLTGDYSYLALWDAIDCRVAYYFGMDPASLVDALTLFIFTMAMPLVAAFQIVVVVLMLAFAVLFLSVVLYALHIYLICMVAITILVYIAPLFVPMLLFQTTKQYFEGWMKTAIGYALQPVVVTAFIALMMLIYDDIVYTSCKFARHSFPFPALFTAGNVTLTNVNGSTTPPPAPPADYSTTISPVTFRYLPVFTIQLGAGDYVNPQDRIACMNSLGARMKSVKEGADATSTIMALFFTITIMDPTRLGNVFNALLTIMLFGYLLYRFMNILSDFAGELTGTGSLAGLAISPTKLVEMVGSAVGAVKNIAEKKMKGDGGEGGG